MTEFLNTDGDILTSARNNGKGMPITDVSIKETKDIVSEEELAVEMSLDKGEGKDFSFDASDIEGYRVLVAPENTSASLLVRRYTDFVFDEGDGNIYSSYENIVNSLGNGNMLTGHANKSEQGGKSGLTVWSGVTKPMRQNEKIRITHPSTSAVSSSRFKVYVIKYRGATVESDTKEDTPSMDVFEYRRTSAIPPQENFPNLNSTSALVYDFPIEIELLEWQTNHRTMPRIYIEVKSDGEWVPITRAIERDGSAAYIHTPERIQMLKSSMWEVLEFDKESEDRFFKFGLRKPLIASEGIRIYIRNESDEFSYAGGIVIKGRRI